MNSYIFAYSIEIHKFKTKGSEIHYVWVLFQKIFQLIMLKKTGLYWYVYDVSVDYHGIDVDDILDTHKYLMNKHRRLLVDL